MKYRKLLTFLSVLMLLVSTASAADITLSGSESYTAQNGDVLTGSTSGTVTIANNASITLNNATITGGIICEGNATITLVGNNNVTGKFYYAGVQVGGSGTTLTIKGDGSLTATGGDYGAGIGTDGIYHQDAICGNIVIESGTIIAQGGEPGGAGIGTGLAYTYSTLPPVTKHMGDIVIKGGIITAIGGDYADIVADGIGCGIASNYGTTIVDNIIIYDGITKVEASRIGKSPVFMHETTDVTANKSDYFVIIEDGNRRIIMQKDDTDYNVTIDADITGGTVTVDKTTAKAGEFVTLTITPASGYGLQSLTVKDASDNDVSLSNRKFIMPKGGVTISATFIQTTAAFVQATGVLTLNSNVVADEVKAYRAKVVEYGGIEEYSPVTSVVCEPGTVLPVDCSDLFLNFYNTSDNLTIDLSNADVSGVTNMSKMFGSSCVTTIYVNSAWSMGNVTSSDLMFSSCPYLVGGNGTMWEDVEYSYYESNGGDWEAADVEAGSSSYAIIDGKDGKEGYLTHKKGTPVITTAPSAKTNLVYNGEGQELITAGTTNFGDLLSYSLDGVNYSADIPTATDAGTYTVYYKVENSDNWNEVIAQTVEVTITPKVTTLGALTLTQDQNGTTATLQGEFTSTETTSLNIATQIEVSELTFQRTFTAGVPATVMLPFSFAADKVDGKFYTLASVAPINGVWTATMSNPINGIIKANTPYIFMPTKDITESNYMTFKDITLKSTIINDNGSGDWTLHGVYEKTQLDGFNQINYGFAGQSTADGISVGDFIRAGEGVWADPMRCYLTYTGNDSRLTKSALDLPDRIRVVFPDEVEQPDNGEIVTPVSEFTPENGVKVWSYDGTIYIEAQPDMDYTIVDLTGRIIKTGVTHSTHEELNLNAKGIVIVKIGNKSFKIK